MAKRKRNGDDQEPPQHEAQKKKIAKSRADAATQASEQDASRSIQIITGSYNRVLHGVVATLPATTTGDAHQSDDIVFNDNFLFNAHGSAIRCLALSPLSESKDKPDAQKIMLASGGTDERINLYHVSTTLPHSLPSKRPLSDTKSKKPLLENPKNKEIGSLLHHSSSINVLHFPTRSKLLSGAEDNTVAVSRTRDWMMLSTFKAPIPRAVGRPSGDTAPPGGTPAGINDFAVHPSMKLMISVGKGEKCMRLWNLVTGKKAGVLNFERSMLQAAGEGKFSSGEGRKVVWNAAGDEFVVGFERGAILFAMDSKPKACVLPAPKTKLHQMRFYSTPSGSSEMLAVSTEDGRLLFYAAASSATPTGQSSNDENADQLPDLQVVGELGGKAAGLQGRIKDFEILAMPGSSCTFVVITAGSDGAIRIWQVTEDEFKPKHDTPEQDSTNTVGELLGTYATNNRITCLKAFFLRGSESKATAKDEVDVQGSESEFEGLD